MYVGLNCLKHLCLSLVSGVPHFFFTTTPLDLTHTLTANSHRHARHDKTVLSVSRPLRRCELGSRQLKTVADRKFEFWTRSEQQSSNSHRHTRHDTDRTVLSCLLWWCELSRPDRPTSAFSVGVCRAAQALPVRPVLEKGHSAN